MNRIVKIKKRLFDRVSAFLMVMLVILNATFMVPVHAAFIPAIVDTTVAVSSALGALGVGVSGALSNADWKGMIDAIGDQISQDVLGGVTATQVGNAVQYHLTHDFLQSVSYKFGEYIFTAQKGSDLLTDFPKTAKLSQSNLSTPLSTEQFYNAIGYPYTSNHQYMSLPSSISGYTVLQKVFYVNDLTQANHELAFSFEGHQYIAEMNISSTNSNYVYNYDNDKVGACILSNGAYQVMIRDYPHIALAGYLVAFQFKSGSSPSYYLVNLNGTNGASNLYYWPNFMQIANGTATALPANDTSNAKVAPYVYANGNSILPKVGDKTATNSVITALEGTKVGHKTDAGTKDGVDVTVPSNANTANPSKLRDATATQTKVVGDEAATEADKTADDTYNQTNNKDTTPPKSASMPSIELPTGLQKKFPFCLPWDLAAIYKLFNVAPRAPVWTIPVNIDQGFLHVHQTYTYDLNQNNVLDTVLPIFKWFLNISFCIGLIFITKRIMT